MTMAVIITVVLILVYRLQDRARAVVAGHPRGRARGASNGINTVTTKLLAFALGATTAGFAGVFSASS